MRIIDWFCGAGLASDGYHAAFPDADIVGIDIVPQPNYPYTFVQADVTQFDGDDLLDFTFAHASPPCHDHSPATGKDRLTRGPKGTGWMLEWVTELLQSTGMAYVVENVENARMPPAPYRYRLCGSTFGLDVRRHRKFITNVDLGPQPACQHGRQTPRFQSLRNNLRKAGQLSPVVGVHGHLQYPGEWPIRCAAMGVPVDRCTNDELCQAIPPAYTEWIGHRLTHHIEREEA